MQNYIARFGHGSAKLARQAQSKEKTLAKMVAQGLTEKVTSDKTVHFYFPSCGSIPPPVIMVQVRDNSSYIFFLSFRRVVNVIYSFLGNSPASEI